MTAPVVSYLVIVGFFAFLFVLVWVYTHPIGNASQDANKDTSFIIQIINISVGALAAAFATVVNFWLGSSAGSRVKDNAAIGLQQTQSEHTGAAIDALRQKTAPGEVAKPASPAETTDQKATDSLMRACHTFFKWRAGLIQLTPSMFGITLTTYKKWEANDNLTVDDLELSRLTAKEIYRSDYWNKMQCGALPKGVDLEVFDFGVNAAAPPVGENASENRRANSRRIHWADHSRRRRHHQFAGSGDPVFT